MTKFFLIVSISLFFFTHLWAKTDAAMEPLTAEIEGQLSKLSRLWSEGADDFVASAFLDPEVIATTLWPEENLQEIQVGLYETARWLPPANPTFVSGLDSVAGLLAPRGPRAKRTELKVVRTQNTAESLIENDILVGWHYSDEERRTEIRAEWSLVWKRQEDRTPLLRELRLKSYQRTDLPTASPPLMDRTSVLFSPEMRTHSSLVESNFRLRHRIQSQLQIDPFGQNGLSVADLNNDDKPDLILCQPGGVANQVFLQEQDGTLKDFSSQSRLDFLDNTTAMLFCDLDNDGDQDAIAATAAGILICEHKGQAVFEIRERFPDIPFGYSLTASDFDRDGDLDIYVCQYYATSKDKNAEESDSRGTLPVPFPIYDANNGGRNALLANKGNFAFEDATEEVGLEVRNRRFSYAALWEDFDGNDFPDLVVVNDFGQMNLYLNEEGLFTESSHLHGLTDSGFGMGICSGDFDRNELPDLYVSNMFSGAGSRITRQPDFREDRAERQRDTFQRLAEGNSLYLNQGRGIFVDEGKSAGVRIGRWAWGCAAPDLNNDGWEDLVVANGFMTGERLDDL